MRHYFDKFFSKSSKKAISYSTTNENNESNDNNAILSSEKSYFDWLPLELLLYLSNYVDPTLFAFLPGASIEKALKSALFWEIALKRDIPQAAVVLQSTGFDFSTMSEEIYQQKLADYYGKLDPIYQELFILINRNDLEAIRSLRFLNIESLPDIKDNYGYSLFYQAIALKREEILTYFYEQTIDSIFLKKIISDIFSMKTFRKTDKNGNTKLHWACLCGQLDAVNTFLNEDKKVVDQVNIDGATPFWTAAYGGHLAVVEYLLKNGAAVNKARRFDGTTPLFIAAQNGHHAVVEYLLKNGAAVHQANNKGATPLYVAAQEGHVTVVDCLLQNGAAVNQDKKNGITPLCVAAHNGHLAVVDCLLKNGAAINQARDNSATPLYVVAEMGHLAVVEYLLQNGADINQANKDGVTPFDIAMKNGHKEVCALMSLYNTSQSLEERITNYLMIQKSSETEKEHSALFSQQQSPKAILLAGIKSAGNDITAMETILKEYQQKCPAMLTPEKYKKILSVLFPKTKNDNTNDNSAIVNFSP